MMAPGENRLSPTTMRRMPVLAQSQDPLSPVVTTAQYMAQTNGYQGVPVVLPNGQTVPDQFSPTGNLMSPVADLSEVVVTGHVIGDTYSTLLNSPESSGGASLYLMSALNAAVGQGGTYDYQRAGNRITGYTQLPQYRDVSNFNVGLLTQAAGLTLDETLSIAGGLAYFESSNYSPNNPYGLSLQTAAFITLGYTYGKSGAFGP
jgi:hypothetical protein